MIRIINAGVDDKNFFAYVQLGRSDATFKYYILDAKQYIGGKTYDKDYLYASENKENKSTGRFIAIEDLAKTIKESKEDFEDFTGRLMVFVAETTTDGVTETAVKVMFYGEPLYRSLMEAAAELDATCRVPVWFIDKFLRFKAVEAAVEAGDITMAVKYWEEFMTHGESPMLGRAAGGCGCHV